MTDPDPTAKSNYDEYVAQLHPHRPHYDPRRAAQAYSTIAATLSGFSFAAVVLLAGSGLDCHATPHAGRCQPAAAALQSRAAAAFLIAFFGCVTGAFVYAATGAEELMTKRSHTMALLGGGGFTLGIGYAFWGLALLSDLFLSSATGDAVLVANLMLFGVALSAPAFLALPAIDIKLGFEPPPRRAAPEDEPGADVDGATKFQARALEHPRLPRRDWLWAIGPSYAVVTVGLGVFYVFGSQLRAAPPSAFHALFVVAIVLCVASVVLTLVVGGAPHRTTVTPRQSGVYAALHTVVIWSLVLLLPPFT